MGLIRQSCVWHQTEVQSILNLRKVLTVPDLDVHSQNLYRGPNVFFSYVLSLSKAIF